MTVYDPLSFPKSSWNAPYNDTRPDGKAFVNYRDSLAVPISSAIIFSIGVIQLLVLGALIIIRRNHEPVKARNALLLLLSLIGQSYIVVMSASRFMIGRWRYPCFLYAINFSLLIPVAFLPGLLRCWRLIVLNELQSIEMLYMTMRRRNHALTTMTVEVSQDILDVSKRMKRALSLWKFWIGWKFTAIAILVAFLIHGMFFLIIGVAKGDISLYFSFNRTCSISPIIGYVIVGQVMFYLAGQLILFVFLFVRRGGGHDRRGMQIELVIVGCQWILVFVVFTILSSLFWKIYVTAERYWPYGYFLFMGCFIDQVFSAWIPVILSFRPQQVTVPQSESAGLALTGKTNEFQKVKSKILASTYYSKQLKDETIIDKFVLCLVNEKEFQNKYFNKSVSQILARHNSDDRILKALEKKILKEKFMSQQSDPEAEAVENNNVPELDDVADPEKVLGEEEREYDFEITDEMLQRAAEEYDPKEQEKTMKIKLLITEVRNTLTVGRRMNLRRLISPLASHSQYFPELGIFHSALLVGPFIIEFNNSGLCIPRNCQLGSDNTILSADIATVHSSGAIVEVLERISKYIIHINGHIDYVSTGGDCVNTMNCQDFVDSILDHLGIQTSIHRQSPIGIFMNKLKTKGSCGLSFYPTNEAFAAKFKMEKKVKFSSHKDIDQFVIGLENIDPMFRINHTDEYALLKAFDRAMWTKYARGAAKRRKIEKDMATIEWERKLASADGDTELLKQAQQDWDLKKQQLNQCIQRTQHLQPLDEEGDTSRCPFGDPSQTSSLHAYH